MEVSVTVLSVRLPLPFWEEGRISILSKEIRNE
jgi:hypothetical protein